MAYSKEDLADAAKLLISKGFSVIPCEIGIDALTNLPTTKKPPANHRYISRKNHTKYATEPIKTETVLDAISKGAPFLGIFNGTAVIIDIDSKNAKTDAQKAACLAAKDIMIAAGLYVETSRNGGFHGIFSVSYIAFLEQFHKNSKAGDNLFEVFVKKNGGYTVIAPSEGYEILQGEIAEFPIIEIDAAISILEALQAVFRPFVKETPAKPTAPAKTPVNGLKNDAYNEIAESALTEAVAVFSEMKKGGRYGKIIFHCNMVGLFSDSLGGLGNVIETLQAARERNDDSEKLEHHLRTIAKVCKQGYEKKRSEPISQPPAVPVPVPVPVEILPAVVQEKKQVKRGGDFVVKKYIGGDILESTITEKIEKLLFGFYPVSVQAPAGCGKTQYCLRTLIPYLLRAGYGVIFSVPFATQLSQLIAESVEKPFDVAIKILPAGEKINKELPENAYITTYDKSPVAAAQLAEMTQRGEIKGFFSIIDEAHLLTEQYSIRAGVIDSLTFAQKHPAKNTLYLTATPDFLRMSDIGAKTIKIETENSPKLALEIVTYEPAQKGGFIGEKRSHIFAAVAAKELQNAGGLPVIMRLNHKTEMTCLSKALIQTGMLKDSEIAFYVSDANKEQRNPTKIYVESNQTLPSGIKLVLASSVMDQAININSVIYSDVMVQALITDMNERTVVQMMARLRTMETVRLVFVVSENRLEAKKEYMHPNARKNHFQDIAGRACFGLNKEYETNKKAFEGKIIVPEKSLPGGLRFKNRYQDIEFTYFNRAADKYETNRNSIISACFQSDCGTKGIENLIQGIYEYMPADRVDIARVKITGCEKTHGKLCAAMDAAKAETKDEKNEMRAAAAQSIIGNESEVLGWVMKNTKDTKTRQKLEGLGIKESSELPVWIHEIDCADGGLFIESEIARSVCNDFADAFIFFARYGFKPADCAKILAGTDKEIKETTEQFHGRAAFWAFDSLSEKSYGLAAKILTDSPAFAQAFRVKTEAAAMIAAGTAEKSETAQSKLDALKAEMVRLESEGQNLKVIKQAIKKQTERMPKTEIPVYTVKLADLAKGAAVSLKEAAFIMVDIFGAVETAQSKNRNVPGGEVAANDIFTSVDIETIIENTLNIDSERAAILGAAIKSKVENYARQNDKIYQESKLKEMAGGNEAETEAAPVLEHSFETVMETEAEAENFDLDAFFTQNY